MKQYITTRELAELLSMTYMGVHQRYKMNRSMPPRIKLGNKWLYDMDDVVAWLEQKKEKQKKR